MPTHQHGKVCYIFMPSKDPQQSGEFYRTIFGWNLRSHGDGGLSFDDTVGEVSGTFVADRQPAAEGNLEVHIMVDDLDASIAAIRASGGTVNPADVHTGKPRWAIFSDPSGNRLGIYQHNSG